jgi:uncharacterized protein with GYD domain
MLFCIIANFTPKALNAIRQNPKSNQRDSVEQLVKAAGGKLVAMYGTMTKGPGALAIIDVDPISAAAITGTLASSDGFQNIKMARLWTQEEVTASREKRVQIHGVLQGPRSIAVVPLRAARIVSGGLFRGKVALPFSLPARRSGDGFSSRPVLHHADHHERHRQQVHREMPRYPIADRRFPTHNTLA